MAKPLPIEIPDDVKARFWALIDVRDPSECWEWQGICSSNGYGRHYLRGFGPVISHRLAYHIAKGLMPADLVSDHLCRNRKCVNPAHIEPVTSRENTLRGEAGLHRRHERELVTHCKWGHALTPDNLKGRKDGPRVCLSCTRIAQNKWRAKKRAARVIAAAIRQQKGSVDGK